MINDVSFFTVPKAFIGHNAVIQRNAILSWMKLVPPDHICLIGNEVGIAEISEEFGITQIPEVRKTELGTPLLSDAFVKAQKSAQTGLICYLNTDIVLLSDFSKAVQCIQNNKFVMIGRRWNLDIDKPLLFTQDWENDIRHKLQEEGGLFTEYGIDYFVFPKNLIPILPEFAVGRPGWDNWLIYKLRLQGTKIIDATEDVTVIHQNHDYSHVPKGINKHSYIGPEAKDNLILVGSYSNLFSINDATHLLNNGIIKINFSNQSIISRIGHQQNLATNKIMIFLIKGTNYIYKRLIYFITK